MHTHTKHINTLSHLSLQCPCCITHHTHTNSVWFPTLLRLFCCLPLEISTGVLNPSLFFSSSFFLLAASNASNSCIDPFFLSAPASNICPLFSLPHFPPCSSSRSLFLFFLTSCCLPLLTPAFQFSCVPALCSASSRPPLSWRQSISRGLGVRTRCRLVTGCMSCRGHHTGQRCYMNTPPGMTTARTEPPPPISEWCLCALCVLLLYLLFGSKHRQNKQFEDVTLGSGNLWLAFFSCF